MFRCLSNTYKAGTYIELNPGFVSSNDFVAEINPCVSTVTTIAAKTDDENIEERENAETLISEHIVNWIKVYPTILQSNTHVTIEANDVVDGTEIFMFDMQGKHVRSFRLNGFLKGSSASVLLDVVPGMYVLKVRRGGDLFTQKLIVQ